MPSRFEVLPVVCLLCAAAAAAAAEAVVEFPTRVVIEGLNCVAIVGADDTVVVACVEAGCLDVKLPLPTTPPPPPPFMLLVVCVKADVTVGN